ncbi:MAG: hypothetical protein QHI48_04950 [Bacteroidota bacterium]|nr:hypothetical protein [Bacteroidota bacterium]
MTCFRELADDHTSGATELIHRLLAVCENHIIGGEYEDLRRGLALLENEQRSMPSFHAVLQILKTDLLPLIREEGDNAEAMKYLLSLSEILEESGRSVSRLFTDLFTTPQRVVTLSRSGTVIQALQALHERSLLAHLTVLESRPMNEGVKTIREFNGKAEATLFVDAAVGVAVQDADCATVGADCISADGFLLNKTGTYPLALCCRERGVPLYVLCDSLKFSPQLREAIEVEDSPASDVVIKRAKDTFTIWNRYFEWTPIDLVKAFVTERGVFTPDSISRLAGD